MHNRLTHALTRTSPKGGPFLGTCFRCGVENLPAEAVSWPCENIANLTGDEVILHAIEAPSGGVAASPEPSHD